jgi:selenide,water dikinase
LVGPQTGDDAAVWRLDDARALVVTADFITPVVDDARTWGRVAAANAASDVYAMGGSPFVALNLVCWNDEELSIDLLGEVLAGAQDIAADGGFAVVGGHTVTDPEPKFGLAVIGEVAPDRMLTNAGLRPGDALVLTKPLGIGVVTTAIKRGVAPDDVIAAAVASMTRLNAEAARVALACGAAGATDVTGFGLLGHLHNMLRADGVAARLESGAVPVFAKVRELAAAGAVPGGTTRNLEAAAEYARWEPGVPTVLRTVLADAQTSGGLLIAVTPEAAPRLLGELAARQTLAVIVAEVVDHPAGVVEVA